MSKNRLLLFLLGLGAHTKIFVLGCIGISELVIFPIAPVVFLKDWRQLKHDGFMPFIVLLAGVAFMTTVVSLSHHIPLTFIVKGIAVYYSLFSFTVVSHRLLRDNYDALGWMLFGVAISSIITIFAFNPRVHVSAASFGAVDYATMEQMMAGELFWVDKVTSLLQLPVTAAYFQTPIWCSFIIPIIVAMVTMATSGSGRSATLVVVMGSFLILLGRKSRRTLARIGRYFWIVAILGLLVVVIFKELYFYAARNGYLSEGARAKYEKQTRGDTGLVNLIVSGRIEPFIGLMAALDKPIIGRGLLAIDDKNYYYNFISKYGDEDDVRIYEYTHKTNGIDFIPAHSHIIGDWLQCGMVGLLLWLYVLWLMFQYIHKYAAVIPQWFGYMAMNLMNYAWHIFFSPMGDRRFSITLFIVCLLFAKAIGNGKLALPMRMELEARRYI